MRFRILGGGFLILALLLHWVFTLPLERRVSLSVLELQRIGDERRLVSSRLAAIERREALSRRASVAYSPAVMDSMGTLRAVRLSVINSLESAEVSGVRLSLKAGSSQGTRVVVTAQGAFEEIVGLSGQLVRPGTGLVLERVTFTPRSPEVGLMLEALTFGGSP